MIMTRTLSSPLHECVYLEYCLRHELRGRVSQLRIEHRGEGVAILGQANSYYSKQLAQAQVMDRSTLPIISN
jgi:hypothetical protein